MLITEKTRKRARKLGRQLSHERATRDNTQSKLLNDRIRWKMLDYNRRHEVAKQVATKRQAAERSDPFVYARIYNHLINGIYTPSDYGEAF